MRDGTNALVAASIEPPIAIRWPGTSVVLLNTKLVNQLSSRRMLYWVTRLTSSVVTVPTGTPGTSGNSSPTSNVTVCTGPLAGFTAIIRPETNAFSVVTTSTESASTLPSA